ncbi:hypothetical protein CB1_000638010 [Camelus ferus]|nr:hypothetical protein CB1_000638010 [Camelus ferus]
MKASLMMKNEGGEGRNGVGKEQKVPLTPDLHYYYILELSFYWSLMFSQFTDIKRKDFGVMFLHHVVSILLITFSYVNNMARVGTLVLCLHDSADALLEAAKMANYAKFQKLCDLLFVMFAMVFITTRLGIFPLCTLDNSSWHYGDLHQVSKDDRSDIESSSDEEDSEPPGKSPHTATTTNGTSGTNGIVIAEKVQRREKLLQDQMRKVFKEKANKNREDLDGSSGKKKGI